MLAPTAAMVGLKENPELVLRFDVAWKLAALSPLVLNRMSPLPVVSSVQATYTLLPDEAILGSLENPELPLRFAVPAKAAPLLLLVRRKISEFPAEESSHTM